jgi:hypothetical protein
MERAIEKVTGKNNSKKKQNKAEPQNPRERK